MSSTQYFGYQDTSYDTDSNWDYKKKRKFKKKSLQFSSFNSLFLLIIIKILIYIPFNFCVSNFDIPVILEKKNSTSDADNYNERNFCQNAIVYAASFKNLYLSIFIYFIIFISIIYILYILNVFTLIFNSFIKPYFSYFIDCSYQSIYDLKYTYYNLKKIIKKRDYSKLYTFFTRLLILIILFLFFIAMILYISFTIYIFYINNK